jgi:hypothetical protein
MALAVSTSPPIIGDRSYYRLASLVTPDTGNASLVSIGYAVSIGIGYAGKESLIC